ncbi:MAG: hypothetical protein KIT35_03170 [Piscinibacter sp.]|uniref:hypothetical protein n=1 Tax=Piscinibacter sp. TaxID=1903157 RepID=UPI002590B74B|nr:hypothetical protein [Piscinibacter sp.]MCW5662814.1 hypothetical protein [Piscinibacter sp.]
MDTAKATSPRRRDILVVDLRGMKAALLERSRVSGLTPSELVRDALAGALDVAVAGTPAALPHSDACGTRARLTLRMSRPEANLVRESARAAGMPLGAYVAGLCTGIPGLVSGGRVADHARALVASCAELSTLARDLRRLTTLLGQGNVPGALVYRDRLVQAEREVRVHLTVAAAVMADLKPQVTTRALPVRGADARSSP